MYLAKLSLVWQFVLQLSNISGRQQLPWGLQIKINCWRALSNWMAAVVTALSAKSPGV